jgi:hypothetical protein
MATVDISDAHPIFKNQHHDRIFTIHGLKKKTALKITTHQSGASTWKPSAVFGSMSTETAQTTVPGFNRPTRVESFPSEKLI